MEGSAHAGLLVVYEDTVELLRRGLIAGENMALARLQAVRSSYTPEAQTDLGTGVLHEDGRGILTAGGLDTAGLGGVN
jgi:hypothetical protein